MIILVQCMYTERWAGGTGRESRGVAKVDGRDLFMLALVHCIFTGKWARGSGCKRYGVAKVLLWSSY